MAACLTPQQAAAHLSVRARVRQAERSAREALTRARVLAAVAGFRVNAGFSGRIWLIGSLAWGGFGERSDVDLVCEALPALLATQLEHDVVQASGSAVDLLALSELPWAFADRVRQAGLLLT